jgi:superfamily II DNA/RNA helicase
VDDVSHVFIFSTPDSPEQYIHRAGRTGRIGKSGRAISLLSAHDIMNYNRLVKRYHIEVKELRPPSSDDVSAAPQILDPAPRTRISTRSRSPMCCSRVTVTPSGRHAARIWRIEAQGRDPIEWIESRGAREETAAEAANPGRPRRWGRGGRQLAGCGGGRG